MSASPASTDDALSSIQTSGLVQVTAVTNAGGLSPVGYVDVLPLVNQIDGAGKATPHGTVHHLPYFRLQGGTNAIIIDPQVGDIGLAVFASRDISGVKANKAQSNPGSRRRFSMADGLYIGGVLNGVPSQFIQFQGNAVNITALGSVGITAPATIVLNTPQGVCTGNLSVGTGATGTITDAAGHVVTVTAGIITNIT